MRFDLNIRESVRVKLASLAQDMSCWESQPRVSPEEGAYVRESIRPFSHSISAGDFRIAGVDGSGDYPSVSYADSFVYVASASGTIYRTDQVTGLKEELCLSEPTLEFLWIPEDPVQARTRWIPCLEALAGAPIREVMVGSDYRHLKDRTSKAKHSVEGLLSDLILPRASDDANVGIQLRSTAELGTALRLIRGELVPRYVLMDTTFSIPLVRTPSQSLFYEHLKRFCCVEARKRDILFMTISKSHGFPSMEVIEGIAAEVLGLSSEAVAEHWFMRLPVPGIDTWAFSLAEERRVPPVGAVTYLFRLHKNTPVMRLDLDLEVWKQRLRDDPKGEEQIFRDLDYSGHDQRSYGYPYPIKACHDRARLSEMERVALRKQIIDAAVAAGMKRSLFRDVSAATGHA